VLFALFPRHLDFRSPFILLLGGTLFAFASLIYVYAGSLGAAGGQLVAILGLAVIGMGFAWLSIRFLAQLAQEERYSLVVGAIVCALLLKTALTAAAGLLVPNAAQAVIIVLLPLLATILLIGAQLSLDAVGGAVDLEELPKITKPYRRVLLILLLMNSLLRAVIRVMSSMGFWGTNSPPATHLPTLDFVLLALVFAAAAYITLVRQRNPGLVVRFLPAFLVILSGFFILDPQVLGLLGLGENVALVLNVFVELFAHLFFWVIIVFGIRGLSIHPFRVAGVTVGLYALASALLTFAMPAPDTAYRLIAVLVLYAFIVVILLAARIVRPLDGLPSGSVVEGDGSPAASARDTSVEGASAGEGVTRADPLLDLARDNSLSPRETEVFLLLAQGRSRPYIQQELFLADGTVKTHISRIYAKLGLTNRQELITFVQEHTHP
jgi:DNA-binding CsgD family transcriptional regulator